MGIVWFYLNFPPPLHAVEKGENTAAIPSTAVLSNCSVLSLMLMVPDLSIIHAKVLLISTDHIPAHLR